MGWDIRMGAEVSDFDGLDPLSADHFYISLLPFMHNPPCRGEVQFEKKPPKIIPNYKLKTVLGRLNMRRVAVCAVLLGFAAGVAADGDVACERLFDESKSLIRAGDEAENDQAREQHRERLMAAQLKAVAAYLGQCTDRKEAFEKTAPEMQELARLAALGCKERQAELEWLDVDQDGSAELVLHGPGNSCDYPSIYQGGWSGVFFREAPGGAWTGQVIWPVKRRPESPSHSEELFAQYKPSIRMLGLVDSEAARYMALESRFQGADHTAKQLAVIRWLGRRPQEVLAVSLSDWCGQPASWNFQANGTVTIPAAEATPRCEARTEQVFALYPSSGAQSPGAAKTSVSVLASWLSPEQRTLALDSIRKILAAPGDDSKVSEALAKLKALPGPTRGHRKQARTENDAGLAALRENRFGEAAARFGKALQADSGDVEIWNNLGYALVRKGDFKEAEAPLFSALILRPDRASAWANLAMAYARSGDVERSTAALIATYRFSGDRAKTGEFMKSLAESENDPALREACRRASEFAASRFPAEPVQRKYRCAPSSVSLSGTLTQKPGPDAEGRPEVFPALQLDQPITVETEAGNKADTETETNVSLLQIIPHGPKSWDFIKQHQGEKVTLSGTLSRSISAHHHTRVLLELAPEMEAEHPVAPSAFNESSEVGEGIATRYGKFEIEQEEGKEIRLLFNGQAVHEWTEADDTLPLNVSAEKPIPDGDKDYVLFFQNSGGIACPGTFLLFEASAAGAKEGPDFGTCGDLYQARVADGKLVVEMPGYIPHPELLSKKELKERERTKTVYQWDGKKLSEKEARKLPKDFSK
jgi:hypothetical protein